MPDMKKVYLKKNEERRIKLGHLWVFSNEIDTTKHALKEFTPGECVTVMSARGEALGSGYINPHTLLAIRLYSHTADTWFNAALIQQKIERAHYLRQLYFQAPYYRLCFGEGDLLPGIIIDRFNDIFVVQLTTQGAFLVQDAVVSVLLKLFHPRGILLKNEQQSLSLEGLNNETSVIYGEVPEEILIHENNISFYVPLYQGQKTGWFYDQRYNRARLAPLVKDKTVLDVFAYLGSFGVYAGMYGAKEVTFIEASKFACEYIHRNVAVNKLQMPTNVINEDAFDALKKLRDQGQKFDVVLVDPPAFIKRKKDFDEGFLAYQRINELALTCLKDQGFLVSTSCSMQLSASELEQAILKGNKNRSYLSVLDLAYQAPDHPWHPMIPETLYLKSILMLKNKY